MPSVQLLDAIGQTPLVELRHVVAAGSARVVAKLESANPTGSMKDRMARALVEHAAADGRLPPGGTVVEYTAGTTGISLALVCAALGYRAHFVFSDAFSDEKRYTMRAYGATITDVPSDNKQITEQLIKTMIRTAGEISRQPGHWWCDQLNNRDGEAGYHPLGEEIWQQAGRRVDAFVHAVSTAHSIHGTAHALRDHNPDIRIFAVEPADLGRLIAASRPKTRAHGPDERARFRGSRWFVSWPAASNRSASAQAPASKSLAGHAPSRYAALPRMERWASAWETGMGSGAP